MAATSTHPFANEEPGDVPLARSPLVRTIAQIRFPHPTAFVADQEAAATEVVKRLAAEYPILEIGQDMQIVITPDGVTRKEGNARLWRLATGDRSWQISFGINFLAIETSTYVRRRDFASRLSLAWQALLDVVNVPHIERLGVRYINQVTEEEIVDRIPELVRQEILGISGLHGEEFSILSSLNEAQYRFRDGSTFNARWGLLPPRQDLGVDLPAYDHTTWVLDMDSFQEWAPGKFTERDLYEEIRALSLRGYQFFRWAFTDEALRTFGANQ
ncbi:TIGR04255 family protein [Nocardioides sp. NPDC023903]|uniref:TIGR04255 family protein n=1 Tax=Nocardioides sp. NPDC023903 TaxID=3157195 RepID=UPI0033DD2787